MNLSERLKAIVAMIPPSLTLVDVGSDHAYVPIAAVQQGKCQKAIAGDLRALPCEQSRKNILSYGLDDCIEVREGDGLSVISPGEVDGAVIAGMGGGTILAILKNSPTILHKLKYLVIQPQGDEAEVRIFLQKNEWKIIEETIIKENDLIYQIILAVPGYMPVLSDFEAKYGIVNVNRHSNLLKELLLAEVEHKQFIADEMNRATKASVKQKRLALLKEIQVLEEVLKTWSE